MINASVKNCMFGFIFVAMALSVLTCAKSRIKRSQNLSLDPSLSIVAITQQPGESHSPQKREKAAKETDKNKDEYKEDLGNSEIQLIKKGFFRVSIKKLNQEQMLKIMDAYFDGRDFQRLAPLTYFAIGIENISQQPLMMQKWQQFMQLPTKHKQKTNSRLAYTYHYFRQRFPSLSLTAMPYEIISACYQNSMEVDPKMVKSYVKEYRESLEHEKEEREKEVKQLKKNYLVRDKTKAENWQKINLMEKLPQPQASDFFWSQQGIDQAHKQGIVGLGSETTKIYLYPITKWDQCQISVKEKVATILLWDRPPQNIHRYRLLFKIIDKRGDNVGQFSVSVTRQQRRLDLEENND